MGYTVYAVPADVSSAEGREELIKTVSLRAELAGHPRAPSVTHRACCLALDRHQEKLVVGGPADVSFGQARPFPLTHFWGETLRLWVCFSGNRPLLGVPLLRNAHSDRRREYVSPALSVEALPKRPR